MSLKIGFPGDDGYTIEPTAEEPKGKEIEESIYRIFKENRKFLPSQESVKKPTEFLQEVYVATYQSNRSNREKFIQHCLFSNCWEFDRARMDFAIKAFSLKNEEFAKLVTKIEVLDQEKTREKLDNLCLEDPTLKAWVHKVRGKIHLGETEFNLKKVRGQAFLDQAFIYIKKLDSRKTIDNLKNLSEERIFSFIKVLIQDSSQYEPILVELFGIFKDKMKRVSDEVLQERSNELFQLAFENDVEFIYTHFLKTMCPKDKNEKSLKEKTEKSLKEKNEKYIFKTKFSDSEDRENALTLAVMKGHTGLVKDLIKNKKFSSNQLLKSLPCSVLAFAASQGNLKMCQLLVELGANANQLDFIQAPLFAAANNHQEEVVLFLLEQGAKVSTQGLYGSTALSILFSNEQLKNLKAVENSALNFSKIEEIESRVDRILKLLLEYEDNSERSKKRQNEAFHCAVKGGYLKAVDTFLERDCIDLNEIDRALEIARKKNYKDIEERLNKMKENPS